MQAFSIGGREAVPDSDGNVDLAVLKDVDIDDWYFDVSAVSADGYENSMMFPGVARDFERPPQSNRVTAEPAEAVPTWAHAG